MKKNAKRIASVAAAVVVVAVLLAAVFRSAGGNLDVVGSRSVASFDAVLKAAPDLVRLDEESGGWSLAAPDGSARFIWGADHAKSSRYDVMLELDARPFADAGLDAARLPANYAAHGGALTVGAKLGSEALVYDGDPTPLASYGQIVNKHRDSIGYHAALDHFGVKLGDGNRFEWAKDLSRNTVNDADQDKDIVFALNPEPLTAAGVDPEKVAGWVYAQVEVDENGKMEQVYKFLKPFNLK